MEILNNLFNLSSDMTIAIVGMFVITFLGYLLGRVVIKGVFLGTAGVFLVALLFGYLFTLEGLLDIPILKEFFIKDSSENIVSYYKMVETMGLIMFVTAVGFIAGPNFFSDFKKNAKSYILLGVIIVVVGSVIALFFSLVPGIGSAYSTGILSGALTSTPAFAASKAVVGAEYEGLVALGHAVAYPVGVIGVVLFVQLVPKALKVNIEEERKKIRDTKLQNEAGDNAPWKGKLIKGRLIIDDLGLAAIAIAIVLGILLGAVKIPLTSAGFDGTVFTLGNTGGPLIMALILGHFGAIGRISLRVSEHTLVVLREFGLVLFLIGAGVEGGVELVEQIAASEYGIMLVVYGFLAGAVMTFAPMFVGLFVAKNIIKMPVFNYLGSITGGMTSTPALGALIKVSGTDDVAGAYASTYPIALVLVVILTQFIVMLI